ncbi:Calcineurin-binding protein cabin-1, partial [Fasciolopsis buskii]
HLSEESRITDCSLLSTFEKIDCERHPDTSKSSLKTGDTSVAISSEVFPPVHAALSPNVLDLLRPSKKNTRECEEVRVIKLYRHALRLCSTENLSDEVSATPLLESIIGSFLLRAHDLPNQLKLVKFAACKLLGGVYMKSKQDKKAIKFLIKAIELDRNDLTLWLRLARVAIRSAKFTTATIVLEHILAEHPSHPIALPLALLVYLVTSDFEVCLELVNRALQLDASNERAIYCVQYILRFQPSLSPLIEDVLQSRPNILTGSISDETKQQLDEEFLALRARFREQLDTQAEMRKIVTVSFPERLASLTWTLLMDASVKMFDQLSEKSVRHFLRLTSSFLTHYSAG